MKRIKTLFAILLTVIMVLPLGSTMALAASDSSISVTGLANSDKVTYYRVVKWVDGSGWALDAGFTSLDLGDILDENGITQSDADAISACAAGATAIGTNMAVSGGK